MVVSLRGIDHTPLSANQDLSTTQFPAQAEKDEQTRWVEALQKGEQIEENSARIFEALYPSTCRFFQRRGFSAEDSEELAQEALIATVTKIHELENPASLKSWCLTISINIFRNEVRRRTRARRSAAEVPLERPGDEQSPIDTLRDSKPLPDQELVDVENRESFDRAVALMPKRMRQCVELRFHQGKKFREIATILRISIGTVKAHLAEGKVRLLEELGPDDRETGPG